MPTDAIGRRPGCPLPHEDPSDYRLLFPASAGWQHNPSPSSVKSIGNCVIHRVALTDRCIYSAVPYNMVNFIREIYERHPIALLLGRAMGVLRGISLCLIKGLFQKIRTSWEPCKKCTQMCPRGRAAKHQSVQLMDKRMNHKITVYKILLTMSWLLQPDATVEVSLLSFTKSLSLEAGYCTGGVWVLPHTTSSTGTSGTTSCVWKIKQKHECSIGCLGSV